jgi:hypothetical protein
MLGPWTCRPRSAIDGARDVLVYMIRWAAQAVWFLSSRFAF